MNDCPPPTLLEETPPKNELGVASSENPLAELANVDVGEASSPGAVFTATLLRAHVMVFERQ